MPVMAVSFFEVLLIMFFPEEQSHLQRLPGCTHSWRHLAAEALCDKDCDGLLNQ